MEEERRSRQPWLSPVRFDGSVAGAYVRSLEVVAFNVGVFAMAESEPWCMGPLALVSLGIIAGQFGSLPKYRSERHRGLQGRWNIHAQDKRE